MSRRPAKVTQADVARTIRAAKQAGAAGVDVLPDGTIRVTLLPSVAPVSEPVSEEGDREIVL